MTPQDFRFGSSIVCESNRITALTVHKEETYISQFYPKFEMEKDPKTYAIAYNHNQGRRFQLQKNSLRLVD